MKSANEPRTIAEIKRIFNSKAIADAIRNDPRLFDVHAPMTRKQNTINSEIIEAAVLAQYPELAEDHFELNGACLSVWCNL